MQPDHKRIYVTEFDRRRLEGLVALMRARSNADHPLLNELEAELKWAQVIQPGEVPLNVVTMNSKVRLLDLDTGERFSLTLVFPGTDAPTPERVSVLAPVGLALLGAKQGDELSLTTHSRARRLRVEQIEYQPEAAGNFAL